MALADDLVQAVAEAIRDSYDDDPIRCNKPSLLAAGWEARAAVLATLRGVADAYVSVLTVADLRELAEAVERGGQPDGD